MAKSLIPTRRFEARIEKRGVNACVDVPERVSRAFRDYADRGRVRVEGKLNATPFRATMVPAASGGHRLFVNQGLRNAAAVAVGDRVRFSLRPAPFDERAPRDVAVELGKLRGAKAAFAKLSPSHRRELLRYIDDAKTPASRQKRIREAAAQALGERASASSGRRARSLWTCPKCGHEFVNKNQYHSCKRYELDDVFGGKPAFVRELFDRLHEMLAKLGPVKLQAYRDKVAFMVNVRFAGATPRRNGLDVGLWLTRRIDHPRFRRIETLHPTAHIHNVRLTHVDDVDDELSGWLSEAYAIGRQEHLRP